MALRVGVLLRRWRYWRLVGLLATAAFVEITAAESLAASADCVRRETASAIRAVRFRSLFVTVNVTHVSRNPAATSDGKS